MSVELRHFVFLKYLRHGYFYFIFIFIFLLLECSSSAVVQERGDSYRDTMAATLAMDGTYVPPFYIKTQYANASKASGRRPAIGSKPIKGMTNEKMKEYCDHISLYTDDTVLLVWDRLSSHQSKEVIRYFESKRTSDGRQKFDIMALPPKGAFLISPLDWGFFGYWKNMYYKRDRSSTELKFLAAKETWKQVSENAIVNFFKATYIIGTQSESELRKLLRSQVRSGIPEELEEVWDFYDGWKSGAFDVDGVSAPRDVPMEKPLQLGESTLNGTYWCNWGGH